MSTMAATWNDDRARKEEAVRLSLWIFLATVAMLFFAFASAYLVRRTGSDWSRIELPSVLWLNTVVLVLSSVALEAGHALGARRQWTMASAALGISVALGLGFLYGQYQAWHELMAAGVFLPASPHSSFFYVMTGAHGVHVVAAVAVLLWASAHTWMGLGARDGRRWTAVLGFARTFWHFLLGVWAFVMVVLTAF
ncbi:MAG: cytochrome c oxidase subunit 3 [Vicinamibacterales bacterium]